MPTNAVNSLTYIDSVCYSDVSLLAGFNEGMVMDICISITTAVGHTIEHAISNLLLFLNYSLLLWENLASSHREIFKQSMTHCGSYCPHEEYETIDLHLRCSTRVNYVSLS